jgi:hypothetical protein
MNGKSVDIFEADTSSVHYWCLCNFNTYTTFIGLDTGIYHASIYRQEWPDTDSVFIGSIDFTVLQSPTSMSAVFSYCSSCMELTGVAGPDPKVPGTFSLDGNYPNPFNPSTVIHYRIFKESRIKLEIANGLGQIIEVLADGIRPAGNYKTKWDTTRFSSGIYFCRLTAGSEVRTGKMILVK